MKKLISILMIVAMIASIAAINTSAAGQVLFADTFEGDALDPTSWIVDGNKFFVEEGWCKGWGDAVVNHTYYYDEDLRPDGNKQWSSLSTRVDLAFFDFDRDYEDHWAGLWWKDYIIEEDSGETETGNSYVLALHVERRCVTLEVGGDFVSEDVENPIAIYDLPEDFELKVDVSNPTISELGMRVTTAGIEGYLNGQKVIDYKSETPLGSYKGSPLLFWNSGMYVGYDNLVVATADYPLFAADTATPPADDNGDNNVTPPADDNGDNNVTPPADDNGDNNVTPPADDNGDNNVTPPADDNNDNNATPPADDNNDNNQQNNQQQNKPADTNQGGNTNQPTTGTQTGDAAIVVLAVMIVAFGTAVAVKKISVR